jgi:hypothetical protein
MASVALAPEFRWDIEQGAIRHQFKLQPFYRYTGNEQEQRHHGDLRGAYWRANHDIGSLLIGLNKVFWGVTESRHLVDIVNQSDVPESFEQEDKLGQAMIALSTDTDWGSFGVMLMPYFRERRFSTLNERLALPLRIDQNKAGYESSDKQHHLDSALSYSHYLGAWDIGLSYFQGTSREAILQIVPTTNDSDHLRPYYEQIQQAGLDLQYTHKAWLWKLEAIRREGDSDHFAALVAGFEYTHYQIGNSDADLGLLFEWHRDTRNAQAPASLYNKDLFVGSRLAFNDSDDSSLLVGLLIDPDSGELIGSIEAHTRLLANVTLDFEARVFAGANPNDVLYSLEQDDYLQGRIRFHF